MDVIEHITNRLHNCFANDFRATAKREKHSLLVRQMHDLAVQLGFTTIHEFPVQNLVENRVGRIDIVWLSGLMPVAAFEVDSSLRKKSLLKLLAHPAMYRIWIYYGPVDPSKFVAEIDRHSQIHVFVPKGGAASVLNRTIHTESVVYLTSPKPHNSALFEAAENIRQAVLFCARSLPEGERKIERIREEIIQLVDIALVDWQASHGLSSTDKRDSRGKTYHERLAEIRKKHPRAYDKWTPDEEQELLRKYQNGATINELSVLLARRPGAIRSRLRKRGLLVN